MTKKKTNSRKRKSDSNSTPKVLKSTDLKYAKGTPKSVTQEQKLDALQ